MLKFLKSFKYPSEMEIKMKNVPRVFFSFFLFYYYLFIYIFHAFNQVRNICVTTCMHFLMLPRNRNIGLQNLIVYFRDESLINYFHFNWDERFFVSIDGSGK